MLRVACRIGFGNLGILMVVVRSVVPGRAVRMAMCRNFGHYPLAFDQRAWTMAVSLSPERYGEHQA